MRIQGFRGNCDPKASWGCAPALPNQIQVVFLGELLLGQPIFSVRQKGVLPLLLPASMLQLPRCLVRICNLFHKGKQTANWQVSKSAIAAGKTDCKIEFSSQMWATRPHLAIIFEKLLDQKTFGCLRLVLGKPLAYGSASWGTSPACLGIAIAPEILYSHCSLSIEKAIAILSISF